MTVLGLVTVAAVLAAWLFRRDAVQLVLGVAAVFPQTAGLLLADKGFPLFYLAVSVLAVLAIPRLLMALAAGRDTTAPSRRHLVDLPAVGLVVWGAVISYAGPRIFAGVPVFDPSLGVDVQVGALTPLAPTLGNAAQAGYLAIAVVFLLAAGRLFPVDRRMVAVLVWATVLLAGARLVAGSLWPLDLIQTMPGLPYQNGDRAAGTFYEPSVLGMYLTAAAGYFGAQLLMHRAAPAGRARTTALAGLGLVAVEFVANGSGTALVGLGLVTVLGGFVLLVRIARERRLQARPVLIAGAVGVAGIAITQLPAMIAYAVGMVQTKQETISFVARGASNQRSLELVIETLGLGVGLGGNRPSSLPLFVVSCLGVPGAALLVAIVVLAVLHAVRGGHLAAVWTLLGALTAGAVAVPDLSTPLLWVAFAGCVAPALRAAPDPEAAVPRELMRHG
jgi:hypothetical protein